jgi:hypothetical protein
MIYFAQAGENGPVKIGYTENRDRRMREVQGMNGEVLTVLATLPGGRKREAELHRRFAHLRRHGEWFEPGPELMDYVRNVRDAVLPVRRPQRRAPPLLPPPWHDTSAEGRQRQTEPMIAEPPRPKLPPDDPLRRALRPLAKLLLILAEQQRAEREKATPADEG